QVLQRPQVRCATVDVDVRAVRLDADRMDLRAELRECARRKAREGAVRAVDADPQAREVGAEALDDVREVRLRGVAEALGGSTARCVRVEERLDLLLLVIDELAAGTEELDAV